MSVDYNLASLPKVIRNAIAGVQIEIVPSHLAKTNNLYEQTLKSFAADEPAIDQADTTPTTWNDGDLPKEDEEDPFSPVHTLWVPPEIKKAYLEGNYDVIDKATKQNDADLEIILHAIRDAENNPNDEDDDGSPFIEVIDEDTNEKYQLLASDNAWMWVRTIVPTSGVQESNNIVKEQPTTEIGTFTKNSNFLGISTRILTKWWLTMPVGLVSFLASRALGQAIRSRMLSSMTQAALEAQIQARVAAGFTRQRAMRLGYHVTLPLWKKAVASITGILAETIVGFILFWLFEKLIDIIYRPYYINLDIHNWDFGNSWKVAEWYSDQAKIGGDKKWEAYDLPAPRKAVPLPKGFAPSTVESNAKHIVYSFENSVKVLAGLGIAIKVVAQNDPTKGFMFKYLCARMSKNTMGIRAGLGDGSLENFYNNKGEWSPAGTKRAECKLSEMKDLPVILTTKSLSGEDTHVYRVDLHIGGKTDLPL